jgi:hypothetical protein
MIDRTRMRRSWKVVVLAFAISLPFVWSVQAEPTPTPTFKATKTVLGTTYCVYEDFLPTLDAKAAKIRETVRAEHAAGKLVGYISIPLSATGGGNAEVNKAVSAAVKERLEKEYGGKLWMLAPGAEEATIPQVGGKDPRGQEYMYMWTQVLAGEDGLGRDFDLFYFTGTSDFWQKYGVTTAAQAVAKFEELADGLHLTGDPKRKFVSYYTLRASASASKGAHDEWNILRLVNEARRSNTGFGIGVQIASFYDGRPVEIDDLESSVSTGYEGACK